MKLISDFDGVWTNPDAEAKAVHATTLAGIKALTGAEDKAVLRALAAADRGMDQAPTDYGWTIKGQISAFSDEDPFVRNNALAHFIEKLPEDLDRVPDEAARDLLLQLRQRAIEEHGEMTHFANAMFTKGTTEHREQAKPKPSDEVVAAMHAFLKAGHDVVIVSNSSTSKIADFLSRSTLPYVTGGPDAHETGKIRIRGGAMKFMIGDDPSQTIELGGRTVRVDRASYQTILEEEQGDAIIGDVVSLDFSLPYKLRKEQDLDQRFFVVCRHYTPRWSWYLCYSGEFEGVTGLPQLPYLVKSGG